MHINTKIRDKWGNKEQKGGQEEKMKKSERKKERSEKGRTKENCWKGGKKVEKSYENNF